MDKNLLKEPVNWMTIKWLKFCKTNINTICYKTSFTSPEFSYIDIGKKLEKDCKLPQQKFNGSLPISIEKKKDLVKLCTDGVIPNDYHSFYKNLTSVIGKVDFIDAEEE